MVTDNPKTQAELGPGTAEFLLGEGLELKKINEAERTFTGLANANTIDRMGERIDPAGVELRTFRKQPLLLIDHRSFFANGAPGRIGEVTEIEATDKGLPITARVYDDYDLADYYWPFIAQRRIAGLSIGYLPTSTKWVEEMEKGERTGYRLVTECELLEVSVVMIPANRDALIKRYAPQSEQAGGAQQIEALAGLIKRLTERQERFDGRLENIDAGQVEMMNLLQGIDTAALAEQPAAFNGPAAPDDEMIVAAAEEIRRFAGLT